MFADRAEEKGRLVGVSYRVATVIGVGVFLGASFLCWLGDSRPAWAQGSSAGPVTYKFSVDRLEVEAQDKNGTSKQVIVRNGADQDDDLEFTVEARSKGRIHCRSPLPRSTTLLLR